MFFASQIYAVGRSASAIFWIHLDSEGGIDSTGYVADDEQGFTSSSNTEPIFIVGALDEAIFAARTGTDEVRGGKWCKGGHYYENLLMRLG